MAETQSAPSIPSEWGAAVAAKVARAIRNACGVEADKYYLAADEIDGACDEAVKAALQVLAEAFVIPGDVLAAHPATLTEAVAAARVEGWRPIETLPYDPMADYDFDLPGDADEGLGYATDTETGEILFLVWWTCIGPGRSKVTHWRPKIEGPPTPTPPTTPGGRTDG